MIAPFDWWLLIVGLAAGAALAWLVLADMHRREVDLDERERAEEAAWISATLASEGRPVAVDEVGRVLALHRWYVHEPPRTEESVEDDELAYAPHGGEPGYVDDVAEPTDEVDARAD